MYRTHWVSQELSEKQRKRVVEKASRAPELVVVQPLKHDWTCHRCGGTGDLLMMQDPGPACVSCVGPGDLEFLPAGDALLSRRVKAKKRKMGRCRALQPDPSSLRTARPAGRTAGLGGGGTRVGNDARRMMSVGRGSVSRSRRFQITSSLRTTSMRSFVLCSRVRPLVSTTASAWA